VSLPVRFSNGVLAEDASSQPFCYELFIAKQAEVDLCHDAGKEATLSARRGKDWTTAFVAFIDRVVWAKQNGLL
jgi:hypothetical protein